MKNILMIKSFENGSKLYFDNGEVETIDIKPLKLIKELCIKNGSSLEGRIASFKHLTSTRQKPCVMIKDGLVYIPTFSFNNIECSYLLYNRIVWVKKDEHNCIVLFDNGLKLKVDVSSRTLRKQLKRCDLFKEKLLSKDNLDYKKIVSRIGD